MKEEYKLKNNIKLRAKIKKDFIQKTNENCNITSYKEDYTPKYSGAVSIHVSNLIKFSKFKKSTYVYGNTYKKIFIK